MPSSLYSTPPPPPPPPLPFQTLTLDGSSNLSSSSSSSSYNPSLIIIAAILGAVCLASATIHLLLRFLSHPSPSSSSSPSPQLIHRNPSTSSSPDADRRALIDSLPLLHLPADLASSSDCAVCLSRFRPGDVLRFLPACRHAFHSLCIDAWLRSPAASCPLCRSPVHIPSPPSPPPPAAGSSGGPPSVEDPAAGGGGRGWLKEYVDRLSSSASSSFSSRRFSGRWSRRIEGSWDLDEAESGAAASHQWTTSGGITVN